MTGPSTLRFSSGRMSPRWRAAPEESPDREGGDVMILFVSVVVGLLVYLWLLTRPSKACRYCGHGESMHADGECFVKMTPVFGGEFEGCGCSGYWRP
jgi:hypothetical protein